ncbi:uncharacterized protein I206_104583 [Kwoniella pini CBS 10737]|uniref:Monocarboxylic acid transporter n=1 Tax=Kwoniella pini CBS 10737 TaxID=1296096 RepID=A0A1B9I772_9TREE|nr:monocarboxylic acid transporter [Kwoniella pini CBS 10737]OCF51403.1 monocarboxylic acid transporter [Kwoniella pini CBS 10737]
MTAENEIELIAMTAQRSTYEGELRPRDQTPSMKDIPTVEADNQTASGLGASRDQLNEEISIEVLPPVDGGKQAWLFLLGATYMEMLIWGLPFSIGILHVYWTNTLFEGEGASAITLAATLQTGLLYMSCAFFGPVFTALPRWTKTIQVIGLIIGSVSVIASAFVTKPWHLIITIGILYPLSCASYLPCATLLFEWWHASRGFASGMMYGGTGAGGTIFPFLMQGLLKRFGYKAAMVSIGIGYIITGMIALIPIKRRIPLSRYDQDGISRIRPRIDWAFSKRKALYLGMMVIGVTSLGNFVPSLWLPSYVDDLGLNKPNGTALVAILNAATAIGNGLLGWLSDRTSLRTTILISCVGSAAACAFLWGFGKNSGVLVTFAIIFGLLGPSFSAVWSKIIHLVARDDPAVTALTFSIFAFTRGVGNMSSGPISESLLKYDALRGGIGAYGYKNYGILLIYTSVTILTGGAAGLFFNKIRDA